MILKKKFFIPSVADMIFLSIFLYLCLSQGSQLLGDCDTGYHIRAGEWILDHWSIPRTDIFSFHSPPIPWTAHEWLSEVIMAVIHNFSGLTGVVVFFTFLLALTFYLLFLSIRKSGGNILTAVLIVLLATAASQIHWLARPHVFSLLLFFIWYRILDEYRDGSRNRLYLLPPIMLLWANLHGGYLLGFMLLAIFLTGEVPAALSPDQGTRVIAVGRLKRLLMISLLSLAAACVNPFGWHILLFPFNLVSNKLIMDNVSEFLSPNFHEPSPFKYLLLLLMVVLAASRERLRLTDLLLILVFLNMSLYSVRYITLFSIIVAPILVRGTDVLLTGSGGRLAVAIRKRTHNLDAVDREAGGVIWPILALLAVSGGVWVGSIHYEFNPEKKPVAAVRFLEKNHISGNVFNNDEFGDYLIYATWPRYRVFFDGRSDMYGSDRLKEYIKVRSFQDGWEKILDKYRIEWVFFDTDSHLARYLKEKKDWKLLYQDKVASIFVRDTFIPSNDLRRPTRSGETKSFSPAGEGDSEWRHEREEDDLNGKEELARHDETAEFQQ